ncbi:pyridoxal-phosphate dependent enzyme [soil metagenome]|nr:pyridoxal-phosphate dependent enzyme [Actinomycetota bacterium]MDQ3375822.1 pyridoxal-phosphate dependent enzyme [Actinomycetota bacterium]
MKSARRLSLGRVEQAARVIDPVFLNSPQFVCEPLGEELGVRLAIKVETLNPIRSFKGRGTDALVSEAEDGVSLMCASAGNFGQAMAYSCRKRGLDLTVYASTNANPLKVGRMGALGARVVLHGSDFDEAKIEARRVARERGARFVEDSLDVETLEGAGTMGLEWLRFPEPLDALLVPLGNGAMFNGVAGVMKDRSPGTRMIAVGATGAPAMVESWRTGRLVAHDRIETVADGIGVRVPVPQALEDMDGLVDDAVLVGEDSIIEAMRLLHRHAGVVAEPSGAVGVAAVMERPDLFHGLLVGTIICGGNLTADQMREWL